MQETIQAKSWSMITSKTTLTIAYAASFYLGRFPTCVQAGLKSQIIWNRKIEQCAYSVEWHIILAHELIELNIFRILPPFLPLSCVAWCDWDISNGCIKPHIEYLTIDIQKNMITLETPIYRGEVLQPNSIFRN